MRIKFYSYKKSHLTEKNEEITGQETDHSPDSITPEYIRIELNTFRASSSIAWSCMAVRDCLRATLL